MNVVIKDSKYTQRDLDLIFNSEDIVFATSTTFEKLLKHFKVDY